jgi:hypothetical protein
MSKTMQTIATMTIVAVVATDKSLFVGYDGDICDAGEKAIGVNQVSVDAGDAMPVTYLGIMPVIASAAIAVGAEVESDANGKAITLSTGISNGTALDAATTAGDIIRIVLKA